MSQRAQAPKASTNLGAFASEASQRSFAESARPWAVESGTASTAEGTNLDGGLQAVRQAQERSRTRPSNDASLGHTAPPDSSSEAQRLLVGLPPRQPTRSPNQAPLAPNQATPDVAPPTLVGSNAIQMKDQDDGCQKGAIKVPTGKSKARTDRRSLAGRGLGRTKTGRNKRGGGGPLQ